jgi:serine/threonine protein kinase
VLLSRDGKTVFKSYDYRRFPGAGSRNATLALKYLPNCRNAFLGSDLNPKCTVIEYPKILGDHTPPNNKSALGVIDALRRMHEDGNLHLDVKAGNCVFNGTDHDLSALIDFDLSCPTNLARYPRNYVLDIADGRRHSDAKPGGRGLQEHDTYALAAVLRLSTAVKPELQAQWAAVCDMVEAGQLADAVDELRLQDEYQLELGPDTWAQGNYPLKSPITSFE